MESIEVAYRNIGIQAGKEYHHKFLLYTNQYGQQFTISGWTGENISNDLPFGKIAVLANYPYNQTNPDHLNFGRNYEQKQYRELIAQGQDLSVEWQKMVCASQQKNNIYPYDPLKQNSNTLADSILKDVGLSQPLQDGVLGHWSPASGRLLDINLQPKNPHKENTLTNIKQLMSEKIRDLNDPQHLHDYQIALNKVAQAKPEFANCSSTEQLQLINAIYAAQGKDIQYVASPQMLASLENQTTYTAGSFGISPALKASLDAQVQENQQNQHPINLLLENLNLLPNIA